ncbi:hypothetical protein SDC9_87594 [bioreactor metagenome]|uniref:Uncharacterized protein n=1 Tax=bioreactor metagenome TaxID=1076179 RepID=A0A644ZJ83_9ZZZZ
MILVVVECIHCRHKGGYVPARLPREVGVYFPEIPGTSPADGFVDVARATVVGGNCKEPVSKDCVGVFHILGCSMAGSNRVEPLVHVGVNPQVVLQCGPVHELPHPFGVCPGYCFGV